MNTFILRGILTGLLLCVAPAWSADARPPNGDSPHTNRADFERDYQTSLKVYRVERLTSTTAKALLDPELHTYLLVEGPPAHVRIQSATTGPVVGPNDSVFFKVEESIIADEKANALVVTAIPSTHERITKLLAQLEGMFEQQAAAAEPTRYRLQLALLEGVPAVDSGVPSARYSGMAQTRRYQTADMRIVGAATGAQVVSTTPADTIVVQRSRAGLEARVPDFVANDEDVVTALARLSRDAGVTIVVSPRVQGKTTINMKGASVRQILEVVLPPLNATYRESGGVVHVLSNPELLLDSPPSREESMATMKRYGLSEEELRTFGLAGVRELGSGIVDLAAEAGRAGRARLALTDAYQGEVQYLEVRKPYLIVKGYLHESAGGKVLVENTLYLKQGQPSVLGLTNLRQALILVVRLERAS